MPHPPLPMVCIGFLTPSVELMRSHSQEEPSTFLILWAPPPPPPPWRAPLCSIFGFLIASEKLESEYARKLRQKPTQEKNGQRRGEGEALGGKGEVELGE